MKTKPQPKKLSLTVSLTEIGGGVKLCACIGDWSWTCLARGNKRLWTLEQVERLVRQHPANFTPIGGAPALASVISLL